jgi:LAS superfamily LD-carboxypeptidase LdcB
MKEASMKKLLLSLTIILLSATVIIAANKPTVDPIKTIIQQKNKKITEQPKIVKPMKKVIENPIIIPEQIDTINYLLGDFKPSTSNGFTSIKAPITDGRSTWLRKETTNAFLKMQSAAKKEGIHLFIVSAFRSFNAQRTIFDGKFTGSRLVGGQNLSQTIEDGAKRTLKILTYSALPGTSRHHWGTDIDINSLNSSYFKSGKGLKVFDWLTKNAENFGFRRPYTTHKNRGGHLEEEWHWSYFPISIPLLKLYNKHITADLLANSKGGKHAAELQIIEKYANGIDDSLK